MNRIRFVLIQFSVVVLMMNSQVSRAVEGHTSLLQDATLEFSAPLTAKERKIFGSGWKVATYTSAEGDKFNIFPLGEFVPTGGVIFGDVIPPRISPTGKYAVLDILRTGIVEPGPSGKPEIQTRQYCPILETATGYIVSNWSGELCAGQWGKEGDHWAVFGLADDASSEMLKHQFGDANTLWNGYVKSFGKPFHLSIGQAVSSNLGIYNLMACDRPNASNVAAYKRIAAELKKAGDNVSAGYIVRKFKDIFPPDSHIEFRENFCPVGIFVR